MPNHYPDRVGLVVAVPHTNRALPPAFAWSLANLHPPMNYNTRFFSNLGKDGRAVTGPVDHLRNFFMKKAIEENAKYLFFLDEDVTVPPHTLRQLVWRMEQNPKIAAIGAIYCCKDANPAPLVFRGNGAGSYWDWKVGELFEVSGIGMGATLCRVDAFRSVGDPWFTTVDDDSKVRQGIPSMEIWTEDLFACKKLREAGWEIWADGSLLCSHWDLSTLHPVTLPGDSLPMRRFQFESDSAKVLQIGMDGVIETEGGPASVVSCDWRESMMPNYRCDLSQLPFDSEVFDFAVADGTLAYFPLAKAPALLAEWWRVVKPGGTLRVSVKDGVRLVTEELHSLLIEESNAGRTLYGEKGLVGLMKNLGVDVAMRMDGIVVITECVKPKPEVVTSNDSNAVAVGQSAVLTDWVEPPVEILPVSE